MRTVFALLVLLASGIVTTTFYIVKPKPKCVVYRCGFTIGSCVNELPKQDSIPEEQSSIDYLNEYYGNRYNPAVTGAMVNGKR